ncbi:MAG TPA: DNA gyrase subunit B, partial [Gammaproteobacteria bacterium]|nr:DNA gyrase subunit B [Gammaproteobacteria bacterium]
KKSLKGFSVKFDIKEDEIEGLYAPIARLLKHGIAYEYPFLPDFFSSKEYQVLTNLGTKINNLLQVGSFVKRSEKQKPVESFQDALSWLMEEAKRGQQIQRYKGLGEMNAEQLWETTMDPSSRRLMKVTIEDVISADQIFATLMGDQVEPRRDFIEHNALYVENLDV